MLREKAVERGIDAESWFRWRGQEITRLEGFSDAVFAFAVTLLVVSLEVPRTFDELMETMRGFVAFAICFAMLVMIWYWHYRFFRRYGLQNTLITVLNAVLLFLVLFFVYPLKFLFTLLVDQVMGRGEEIKLDNGTLVPRIEEQQMPTLLVIYGVGYLAVSLTFVLLYLCAYRARRELELNEAETLVTRSILESHLLMGGVGLVSLLIALIGGPDYSSISGFSYFLLAPALSIHGSFRGRQRRAITG